MQAASLQAYEYFPTVVYRDEHPEWVEYLRAATKSYFDAVDSMQPMQQTAFMANDPAFKFLTDYLILSASEILRSQGYDVGRYDFYVSELWGQSVKQGGTNIHIHPNSQVCGWLFMDVPKDGAYPIYYDPRKTKEALDLAVVDHTQVSVASGAINFNNVVPGTVLLSNSWLQHQLIAGMSSDTTRTIHFVVSHKAKDLCQCSTY